MGVRTTSSTLALLLAISSRSEVQFTNVVLDPTSGRVGYHMDIGRPRVYANDVPRGNSGGAFSGTCHVVFGNFFYAGDLPPGLEARTMDPVESLFAGTPRQPGTWRGTLAFDVWCTGGPDQNHYRREIAVTFTIEP